MKSSHVPVLVLGFGAAMFVCGCGGGTQSGSGAVQSPVPVIASISPTNALLDGAGFVLRISGSNFVSGSSVYWGQNLLVTFYFSATSLTASVPADLLSATGTYNITVVNPGSNGGTSGVAIFTVGNEVPTLTSISPVTASMGSTSITLTASGSGFQPSSQLQWNGAPLTTTYGSATQLTAQVPAVDLAAAGAFQVTVTTPAPGGGTSSGVGFTVNSTATLLQYLPIYANDIVWDSFHGRIYASLPSIDGTTANSVAVIDPVAGTALNSVPAGIEPNQLAISEDGSYLWVGEDGTNSVQRFLLPAFTPDVSIFLPEPGPDNPVTATTIVADPDNPHSVAVLLSSGYVPIYDDAVPRVNSAPGLDMVNAIQWGANDSTLYGQESVNTAFTFYVMSVNSSGVTVQSSYNDLLPGFYLPFTFDPGNGYVYGGAGYVANPSTGSSVGALDLVDFADNFLMLPDPAHGLIFVLGQNESQFPGAGFTLDAFDLNTFGLLRTMVLPNACGVLTNLIRWGNSGLAFTTANANGTCSGDGAIYLLDGAFISPSQPPDTSDGQAAPILPSLISISPQSAAVGYSNLTLTVTGTNFEPGAAVLVNGAPLDTTVLSSTQLQAAVPAGSLPVGTSAVSVSNGDTVSLSTHQLYFTVFPSSNMFALNLNALDVAWDNSSGLVYAAVSGLDLQYPNSIVVIDPATGLVVNSQFVGGNPYVVRPSDDGAYLYIGFLSANSVERLTLPNLAPELSWSLGADPFLGNYVAMDIQPAPGAPQTTAVSTGVTGLTAPAIGGVTIFDNNVPRPASSPDFDHSGDLFNSIQWGSNASSLFGYDSESIPSEFYVLNVDSSGVTNTLSNYAGDGFGRIHYDLETNNVFSGGGQVFSGSSGSLVGSLTAGGLVVPDPTSNKVFVLAGDVLMDFNKTSLVQTGTLTLPNFLNPPFAMVRVGSSGFAIACAQPVIGLGFVGTGQLYIINNPTFTSTSLGAMPAAQSQAARPTAWKPSLLQAWPRP